MGENSNAKVEISFLKSVAVVSASGKLDLSDCNMLQAVVDSLGADSLEVVFDLIEISYLDTEVLKTIDMCSRDIIERGGRVAMAVPGGIPEKMFSLTNMDQQYTVRPDLSTAVQHLATFCQ